MRLDFDALQSGGFDRLTKKKKPHLLPPTNNAFDVEPWVALAKTPEASGRDLELAAGAVYLSRQVRSLRDDLIAPLIETLKGQDLLRYAVAYCNRNLLIVRERLDARRRALRNQHGEVIDGRAAGRIGGHALQPNFNVDDVVTAMIDSFPHSLPHAIAHPPTGVDPKQLLEEGHRLEMVYSIEHGLKEIWQNILWEGHRISGVRGAREVVAGDIEAATTWAAWEQRELSLQTQAIFSEIGEVRRGERPRFEVSEVPRTVTSLQRNGRSIRFRVGPPTGPSAHKHMFKIRALKASYLSSFLDEPIRAGDVNVTPLGLVHAICVLSDIANLMLGACPRSEIHTREDLNALSLPVSRHALCKTLRDALGVTDAIAEGLMHALVCDPTDISRAFNEGVWHRPLIRRPDTDDVYILAAPLLEGSSVRQVERWLIAGDKGDSLGKGEHGLAYEAKLRAELRKRLHHNPIISNGEVAEHGLKRGKAGEEIDLFVRIGSTILVGEVKCFLIPSASIERYNHLKKLNEATYQVKAKAEWIATNHEVLHERLKDLPDDLSAFIIAPLLVLNNGVGGGWVLNGVTVTDANLLSLYLANGSYVESKLIAPSGEEIVHEEVLYRNHTEAESNVLTTLGDPPAMRKWKRGIVWRKDDFPVYEGVLKVSNYDVIDANMRSAAVNRHIERMRAVTSS